MTESYSTVRDSQCCTKLSTDTVKSVGESSLPCVVPLVAWNGGPWNPFWRVNTSCHHQNSTSNPHSFGCAPYTASVCSSLPRSRLLQAFIRSKNTNNSGSFYTLSKSCAIFSSVIEIPIPLPALNPCKTLWNCTTV